MVDMGRKRSSLGRKYSPSLYNWLTYFPVESPARLETSLSALRRQKHPLRALRLGRREGGLLSPPTLARRAAWRVISIHQTALRPLSALTTSRAMNPCKVQCTTAEFTDAVRTAPGHSSHSTFHTRSFHTGSPFLIR